MKIFKKIAVASVIVVFTSALYSQEPSPPRERLGKIEDFTTYFPIEGVTSTRIYGDTVSINFVTIKRGVSSNRHLHPDEQIMFFETGSAMAFISDREFEVRPGDILVIPSNVPHHFVALEDATWKEVHGPGFSLPSN